MTMKKLLYLIFLSVGLTAGCDYVDDPIQDRNGGGPNPTDSLVQKVLVEDYTGHKCPNCPEAATLAEDLKTTYGDRVVVVAVHAGFFASTSPGFETDFTTPEGEAMNSFFGFTAYPSGMVNRKGYPSQHILNFQAWPPEVSDAISKEPPAKVNIKTDLSSSTVTTDIEVIYQTSLNGNYAVVVWITEDGIIAPQVHTGQTISDYEHNHVLRASLSSTWGDTISSGPVDVSTPYTTSYTATWNAGWNEQNCHVVAFLCDIDTYEVLQVEEIKLL